MKLGEESGRDMKKEWEGGSIDLIKIYYIIMKLASNEKDV